MFLLLLLNHIPSLQREPAAELYINFFHMVDVAGQPTDEGGKGKEKASSEKDNNNKPLEFSMNNTGSLYDEKQDKVKIRASVTTVGVPRV